MALAGGIRDPLGTCSSALCGGSQISAAYWQFSFELQHPVQRSLTLKWDLSWVLICLQEAPYEPLHKASKRHVTMKTAFLLALATAKRSCEIHALAIDSNLRFNQLDSSVSLTLQTGSLAKNQLSSIYSDPKVIPN